MFTTITAEEIAREARKQAFAFAIFRPESAVIFALTVVFGGLSILDVLFPRAWWWVIVLVGVIGISAMVLSTMHDPHFLNEITGKLFYDKLDTRRLHTPELRRYAFRALEYHRDVFRAIRARSGAPLGRVAASMDEWVTRMYGLAQQIDTFVKDPNVVVRLARLSNISGGDLFTPEEERNTELVIVAPDQVQDSGSEYNLLAEVKKAVLGATQELGASLDVMSEVHQRLTGISVTAMDRLLIEQIGMTVQERTARLEQTALSIRAIFEDYSRPSQERVHIIDVN